MDNPSDEMISERRNTQLTVLVFKQISIAIPERNVHVTPVTSQVCKRLRHERRAHAVFFGDRFCHVLEEGVAISGQERVVEIPVHLELSVRILMVALIGIPAELQHTVAYLTDDVVAAH